MGNLNFIDAANTSGFIPVSAGTNFKEARSDAEITLPRAGTASGLSVELTPRQGTVTLTLMVDDVETEISCTVAAEAKACTDSDSSTVVGAAEKVSLKYTATGEAPVRNLRYALAFDGQ